jgi:crotonobetainyl-CoA:carnitine CoA-transferase CaiB-like acyl-CoA transferase
MRTLGSPFKLSATPSDPTRRAPMLGEHTDEILRDEGFSAEEIAALRAAGAVR